MKKKKGLMQMWGEKINWEKRVKAVCKPCWELKYCPYGGLVEDYPLSQESVDKSCRIFGHDCPVFYVAEPFTETKELRNISRSIPRVVQFRVMKRENQICANCGKSVKDGDIEFDHIIPWSKGGSSDESNVTLLCVSCNRKKGKKFEDKYLVQSATEHMTEETPIEILSVILSFVNLYHEKYSSDKKVPVASDYCKLFGRRKVGRPDEVAVEIVNDIASFFNSKKPSEISENNFKALKFRWGFVDASIHKINDTAEKFKITADAYMEQENLFLNRLGYFIKMTEKTRKKWNKSYAILQ